MSPRSIHSRVLIAAMLVLLSFLGLTGLALDRAFAESVKRSVQAALEAQVYLLLGEAEPGPEGDLTLPSRLPEARLAMPGSGLYAQILRDQGPVWRSESMTGRSIQFDSVPALGVKTLQFPVSQPAEVLFGLSYGVIWEDEAGREQKFRFEVATDRAGYEGPLRAYRRTLWGWLFAAALALLIAQALVLRWGLSPLRRVAREVVAVENGSQGTIAGSYPSEIASLTARLNALVAQREQRIQRCHAGLADLAHSLKTPLAVLRAGVESGASPASLAETVADQVTRMDRTVDYQLQHATAAGTGVLAAPVAVRPIAERLASSLIKVHGGRQPFITLELAADLRLPMNEDDVFEIFGNLMDNACKWCRSRVVFRGVAADADNWASLQVEDDGPGFDPDRLETVMARGGWGDASVPGHGIGLAVVRDLVDEVYGGTLEIDRGHLGGARVTVGVPPGML